MKILQRSNWKAFDAALKLSPQKVIDKILDAGLTGRSGGRFLTAKKWQSVKDQEGSIKFLICNAHESEPGTFKDKFIIKNNPANLIEGIAIACYAMGIKQAYIYFKHGYPELKRKLEKTIKRFQPRLDKVNLNIQVLLGAGAYICGESTAILNSIEGLRGEPRKKPPHTSEVGLYEKPTSVNNVETLSNVPLIFIDKNWDKGLRLFSVSGNVKKPGVYELPYHTKFEDLFCFVKPENKIKAVSFGAARGIIPAEGYLDPDDIRKKGAVLGNCSMILIGEKQCLVGFCKNLAEFFVHESCGKCMPCREGNFRVLEILEKISKKNAEKKDLDMLEELADFISETSFCALGKNSTNHVKTALRYFREEFSEKCR